jgi:hypothetical protein
VLPGSEAAPPGSGYIFHVDDRAPLPDLGRLELLGLPAAGCPTPELISPTLVTAGDIVVTDSPAPPPLPASFADCRQGGWQTFGFRSLGHAWPLWPS